MLEPGPFARFIMILMSLTKVATRPLVKSKKVLQVALGTRNLASETISISIELIDLMLGIELSQLN